MTTNPKARKFRIRRSATPKVESARKAASKLPNDDGFGDAPFPGSAAAERETAAVDQGISEIRREGLTGRQLRVARRLAQKNGLDPASDFDAVRLLRANGIDPFDRANLLELVSARESSKPGNTRGPTRQTSKPGAAVQKSPNPKNLPQTVEPKKTNLPGPVVPPGSGFDSSEMERIQRDIVRRRRQSLIFLGLRLTAFIFLPTFLAWVYFAYVASPGYATKSEFIVQQAESSGTAPGLLGNTSLATSQDSIMVQDFLMSREAMLRLDEEHGYRAHFSGPEVDALQRIPDNPSNEAVYSHYKNNVTVGYNPTEGVIRMEVSALTPAMSGTFSEALISYAEACVDKVTERKRADQMQGSRESFDEAEAKMIGAQQRVLELQESLGVVDPVSETSSLMSQISSFEVQVAEKRLQLQQLLDNTRPNEARVAGVQGDIRRMEDLITDLRLQLTSQSQSQGSLASMSARLRMAEVDLETRTMIMQESLQQMEAARIEAMRQVRFLSLGVAPIPPDEPTYPRVFENTLITLLIFTGIYLVISLTVAVLREQVSN
ncbi:MAG: capsule biosynthesis protein [Boseongicola sp.]|nr:MAG: capsule biosynthesis protein [Boseongicola sp.]